MTEGAFWDSFQKAAKLLKTIGFLKEDCRHTHGGYSKECKDYSRSDDFKTIYNGLVNHRDFDIQLCDESLLQMNIVNGESRLLYIQNPHEFRSFEDFLYDIGEDMNGTISNLDELKILFAEDYEQYVSESKFNSGAVYLRYDVDSKGRKDNENIHAYTHLHVGLNNKIRIPVGFHLTPVGFVLFVLRHVYYDTWVRIIRENLLSPEYLKFKDQCDALPNSLWTEAERETLYLM